VRRPWSALPGALLRWAPFVFLGLVVLVFGAMSRNFLTIASLRNILVQSSSVAILATGMTIVLLTGGIDISVGAIMFLAAAIAGKLVLGQVAAVPGPVPPLAAVLLIMPLGMLFGAVNALLIAGLGMMPFVVTLATLFIGRGLSLSITQTRALNLPEEFLAIGQARILGVPFPILVLAAVVAAAHLFLTCAPAGRQIYAMGGNREAARKAGINTRRLTALVYVISGLCAAVAGIVSVAQLGAVSPTFGYQREFPAIAAAVLGGTSLLGGRGRVLPGTLFGAVLIQAIESGLVMVNADPYLYPVVIGATIFAAVLVDRLRQVGGARARG